MFKTQRGEGGTEERAPPPKASLGPPTWGGGRAGLGGRAGVGGGGHQTGVRFRGSQTEFWVPERGLSRGFSLPAALSPPPPIEESHQRCVRGGFLEEKTKVCGAAVCHALAGGEIKAGFGSAADK